MLYEKMVGLIANIHLYLVRFMRLCVLLFCACSLASAEHTFSSQASGDEQTLWGLERAYWRYVEDNDWAAYSDLWHKDFLGWPSVSSAPVRQDHITDWITSQTARGLAFKTVEFKTAAIQITGDVASPATGYRLDGWTRRATERRILSVSHMHGFAAERTGAS